MHFYIYSTYHPDEPVEHKSSSRVMGAVMEGRYAVVLPAGVSVLEVSPPAGIQGSDGLGQVPVVAGLAQVQLLAVVVRQHPREHRVLVQVVIRATCETKQKIKLQENVANREIYRVSHVARIQTDSCNVTQRAVRMERLTTLL